MSLAYFPIIVPIFAAAYIWYLVSQVMSFESAKDKSAVMASETYEGAISYLKRQYKIIGLVGIILFVVLLFLGWKVAVGFLLGAFLAGLSGFLGMVVLARANLKLPAAVPVSDKSALKTLDISFKGGFVAGLAALSFGLFVVSFFYFWTRDIQGIIGLAFGTFFVSVFARLGGGIFAKAVASDADLADDLKNPALIAKKIKENIVGCFGMAAEIFETYVLTTVAAMILGDFLFPRSMQFVLLPLILGSVLILTTIIGSFFAKLGKSQNIMGAMYKGIIATIILSAIAFYPVISKLMADQAISVNNLYFSTLIGFAAAILIFVIAKFSAPKFLYILLIVLAVAGSFCLAGIYGISITAISMLSISGIIAGINAFGPIAGAGAEILKMSDHVKSPDGDHGASEQRKIVTDVSLASGSATTASKAYAIAAAGLAGLVLFFAYYEKTSMNFISMFLAHDIKAIAGILIGLVVPFLFISYFNKAAAKTKKSVANESNRQFKTISGLTDGTAKPDYAKCVDAVAKSAIKAMLLPVLILALAPILVGLFLGAAALGAMLIAGIVMAFFIGILENKDPAINSFIKGICIIGLLIVGLII